MTREEILAQMMSGFPDPITDLQRQRILDAMAAFSIAQLERLAAAGLRVWPSPNTLPPEIQALNTPNAPVEFRVPNLGTPAAYVYAMRMIRVFPDELRHGRAINHIRHELAHAWDDLKNDGRVTPLASLSIPERRAAIVRRGGERRPLSSDMPAPLPPYNLPMAQMLARYRARLARTLREFSFAHSSTAEAHAGSTPREFYAEGYSVFFGNDTWAQARLLNFAPELFAYLETEAAQFALPAPARATLAGAIREQRLPPIADPPGVPAQPGAAASGAPAAPARR